MAPLGRFLPFGTFSKLLGVPFQPDHLLLIWKLGEAKSPHLFLLCELHLPRLKPGQKFEAVLHFVSDFH